MLPLLLRRLQLLLLRRIRGATGVGHLRLLLQRLVRRGRRVSGTGATA